MVREYNPVMLGCYHLALLAISVLLKRGSPMFARFGALLLLALSVAGFLYSQTSTATLHGVSQDSSGGAVAEAKVTVTNVNTSLARDVVSAEDGAFVIPFLHPGTYELAVQKEGFRRHSQSNLNLAVQQNLSIPITLALSTASTL